MDRDKKPLPPTLGTIPPPGSVPNRGGRGVPTDRLATFRPNPNITIKGFAKPKFEPKIAPRVKKEDTADIDSKLQQRGQISSVLLDHTKFKSMPMRRPLKPKPSGQGLDAKDSSASVPEFTPTPLPSGNFKKKEEDDEHKVSSKELQIDASNPNHPSVLPFVDPRGAVDKKKELMLAELKKQAEADKEAEELAAPEILVSSDQIPAPLTVDGEYLNEDNLFFIQLPTSLPFVPPKITPPNTTTSTTTTTTTTTTAATATAPPPAPAAKPAAQKPPSSDFASTIRGVSGHLGKIVFYKSGKVKLRIGDYLYDINAANNPNFLEELMVLEDTSCYRVGPMSQHLIVTPDLLEKMDVSG